MGIALNPATSSTTARTRRSWLEDDIALQGAAPAAAARPPVARDGRPGHAPGQGQVAPDRGQPRLPALPPAARPARLSGRPGTGGTRSPPGRAPRTRRPWTGG